MRLKVLFYPYFDIFSPFEIVSMYLSFSFQSQFYNNYLITFLFEYCALGKKTHNLFNNSMRASGDPFFFWTQFLEYSIVG